MTDPSTRLQNLLGTFLMGMDINCRGIDGNCREIDLIQGSHPPYRNIEIKRERERERDALMH